MDGKKLTFFVTPTAQSQQQNIIDSLTGSLTQSSTVNEAFGIGDPEAQYKLQQNKITIPILDPTRFTACTGRSKVWAHYAFR